jgi:hypothetical protein
MRILDLFAGLGLVFDAASSGHNPLVDVRDKSEYAALVGSHILALTHFEVLNNLWVWRTRP